ncbi:MAG: glycosyltransferase family 39 protein [Bryobacteraceae bacterium]
MAARIAAHPRLLLVLLVLAIRLPFLFCPVQGDDAFYIAAAEHAQVDPAHPHHFVITAQGMDIDMRGIPHPPGNSWILGGLLAVVGDVVEPVYHAFYLIFSIAAALAAFSIARRFCGQPLWAATLFVATPAFVINGASFETDLPFLAFWLVSIALFLRGVEGSPAAMAGAVLAMAGAVQISYQAVVLAPILFVYLWRERVRRPAPWATAMIPVAVFAAWQIYERMTTGAASTEVLGGHFAAHSLQSLGNKLRNAASLTVHLGWMQSPLLAPISVAALAGAVAGAALDVSPLCWVPFAIGVAILWTVARELFGSFPRFWVGIYFGAALVIFFAGSARYLLPTALPLAILAVERTGRRPRLLAAALGTQLALGMALADANYRLWDFYRDTAESVSKELAEHRSFVNAEWGLRFYAESAGAIPLRATQTFRGGDRILSSTLGAPVRLPESPRLAVLNTFSFDWPLRLIGLNARSSYSSAQFGLRAFDVGRGPVDAVRLIVVNDVKPTLSWLPMNAPEAEAQIISGVYGLEGGAWRWTGRRAVFTMALPPAPEHFVANFRIVDQMAGRKVRLSLDGGVVAEAEYPAAGEYTLRSAAPVGPRASASTVTLEVSEAFRVPGDQRELGLILTGIGYRAP